MKLAEMILTGCLALGVMSHLSMAEEVDDFLKDLNTIRDPFVAQLPAAKAEPVPVNTKVTTEPITEIPPKEDPTKKVLTNQVPAVNVEPAIQVLPQDSNVNPVGTTVNQQNPEVDFKAFVVKGMVWNTPLPQAIINDQVFKVGDHIQGLKILSIKKSGVEFFNNGVKVSINISEHRD